MKKTPPHARLYSAEEFRAGERQGQVLPIRKELLGAQVVKANDDGTIDFVLSTPSPDRSNDVIDQAGWDLTNYSKNPVVLWAHDYGAAPVAKPGMVGVDNGVLKAKGCEFTSRELYQFGWMVGEMYRQGYLSAVSVGFKPKKWNDNEERGGYGVDFHEQELLEFSCVPVPANPEALVSAKAAGIPLEPLIEWAARILDETQEPEARQRMIVPREYVERLHAIANGGSKIFSIGRGVEDSDENDAGEDVLVLELRYLRRTIRRLNRSVDADIVQRAAAAAEARAACPSCTRQDDVRPQAPPAAADVGKRVQEVVLRRLTALTGRID